MANQREGIYKLIEVFPEFSTENNISIPIRTFKANDFQNMAFILFCKEKSIKRIRCTAFFTYCHRVDRPHYAIYQINKVHESN